MEERAERFNTVRLNRREVFQVGVQDFALEGEVGELALPRDGDEARGFQFLKVMGEGCGGDGLALAKVGAGGSLLAGSDLLQDLVTARIGKRLGDEANLL